MIRKLFLFATFLLTLSAASAQAVGEWTIFTQFAGNFDDIVETPNKVYYTSGKRLFSFDKETNETYAYTTRNKLNDTNITAFSYNPEGKYLFIGYDTGNIDLIYDNGSVVNLNDIKEATLPYTKGFNNVNFSNGRIYLATEFGIVILDDKKYEVVESGIYGKSIKYVAPVGDYLMLNYGNTLYYAPINGYHNTLSKFTQYTGMNSDWIYPLGDNKSFLYNNKAEGNKLSLYTFNFSGEKPTWGNSKTFDYVPTSRVVATSKGQYVTTATAIVTFDEVGNVIEEIALPTAVQNKKAATLNGASSVWIADADGIANYDITGGNLTLLSDKYKPEGIVTDAVYYAKFDDWGNLWTGNLCITHYKGGGGFEDNSIPQALTRIKNGHPEDMNAYGPDGKTIPMGCAEFAVDPEFPDRYYQGTNLNGLFVIERDPETGKMVSLHNWNQNNSPFVGTSNWGTRNFVVQFDYEGNLWAGIYAGNRATATNTSTFYVLPKSTLRSKELKDIAKTDWQPSKHLHIDDGGNRDLTALICKHSPVIVTFSGSWQHAMGITKTKGTWADTSDDEFFEYTRPVDQDGKVWIPDRIVSAVEDHRGRVWVGGSTGGIIEISDPANLTPLSTMTRIKVPRNDGTNYADYLCETDMVYSMAVDNSNRKWIATENSGVYLVSENGDKILEHFTTENSPLPSNEVLSVVCDPNSNTVYFGLKTGLVSYNSTSTPSAEDYSEVYAYPNPVRPDYTGYITVTGLMDDSLVKITDSNGNVVYQTRSEGGMAIWDGFDSNHNRAKTGVYYVFASQGPDGSSEGAVTKIMIVR